MVMNIVQKGGSLRLPDLPTFVADTRGRLLRIADGISRVVRQNPNPEIRASLAETHSFVKQSVSVFGDTEDKLVSTPKLRRLVSSLEAEITNITGSLRGFPAGNEPYLRGPQFVVRKNAVTVEQFRSSILHTRANRGGHEVRFTVQHNSAIYNNRLVV